MIARGATPTDAAAIAHVHKESWEATYRGVLPDEAIDGLNEERLAGEWQAEIERPEDQGVRVAIVEDGGRVVGYARYGPGRDDDLDPASASEVYGLYLHPDSWGRGGGRVLMEHAMHDLRDRGFTSVTLWVVQVNERAQGFYRSLGFVPDGRDDALWMGVPERRFRATLGP